MSQHPAISPGRTAVVTGAASGIGLAAARRFAGSGSVSSVRVADSSSARRGRNITCARSSSFWMPTARTAKADVQAHAGLVSPFRSGISGKRRRAYPPSRRFPWRRI